MYTYSPGQVLFELDEIDRTALIVIDEIHDVRELGRRIKLPETLAERIYLVLV